MFKKATRKQSKLKLGISGPSGSGKTKGALRIATGLGGKIAVVDTENGSASLYANEFEFDVCEIHPPYTVEAYERAIHMAEKSYDIIIVDSISHQWKGEGGILSKKEQLDSRGGNSFTNWSKLTPEQERFNSLLLHSPVHIISTLRSKQEYVLTENDKGKQVPKKVGLAPIQRDGLEYEFTVMFDLAMNHEAESSKDRTGMYDGKFTKLTEDVGRQLKAWLESGEKVEASEQTKRPELRQESRTLYPNAAAESKNERKVSEAQIKRMYAIAKSKNWTHDELKAELKKQFELTSFGDLNMGQYDALVNVVETALPPKLDTNEEFPA